ncbi:stonustoxin subunit beta-like [Sinocyclocheilus grahami]|uniref:stonustoxin subunit beta-like n=1 Tax=Sinocyclocheilus grahami TaxID=75366 RepID=UPI0007ACC6C6|nr:PREDICTED: stonustoxin subunit beta-like [Sinocyclocheilus grahami]
MVTEEGCGYVSSALSSNPSHLRELDLSYNHPGDSGVKLLSEKLQDSNCSLDKLNMDHGGESRITAGLKKCTDRFDVYPQVLCRESVCGRCYWEIKWSGDVCISVSYKSISKKRQGKECWFGSNDQSWSLICSSSSYSFRHNKIETRLSVKPIIISSRRIGVFVDHSAGTLSFYSVSDTMSLIHTVQTTFTQPLYPGFTVGSGSFWVSIGSSVKLC